MVTWPSGKAKVCKTFIHQFKSGRHLHKTVMKKMSQSFFFAVSLKIGGFANRFLDTVLQCCPTILVRFSQLDAHFSCRFPEFGRGGGNFFEKKQNKSCCFQNVFNFLAANFLLAAGIFRFFRQFSVCFQVFHFIPIIIRRISTMSIIIGIDHGYYAIKTAHCSFPAGLTSYGEHEPYTRQGLLEFGGCFFVCGSGRQPIQRDKTINDNYYLLTLAAIAKEIRQRYGARHCEQTRAQVHRASSVCHDGSGIRFARHPRRVAGRRRIGGEPPPKSQRRPL